MGHILNVVSGLQAGYVLYGCIICQWDSRWTGNQYTKKQWERRIEYKIKEKNIEHAPLIAVEKILLPPLHIKLGIVKNFVKCSDVVPETKQS